MTEKQRSWLPVEYVLFKVGSLPFPRKFYRGDKAGGVENDALYIMDQLNRLSMPQRVKACEAYTLVYLSEGRYEANTRLRKYAENCEETKHESRS